MLTRITVFLFLTSLSFPLYAGASTIHLPKTGQTACYDISGYFIDCAGTGQDGALQEGVAWPVPRFNDNGNGTVTDNLTGLIWLKDANCRDTAGGINKSNGNLLWADALTWSNNLASGSCGLSDSSKAGDWRLPNITELESLVDLQNNKPALPSGHPFINVQASFYWSSSSSSYGPGGAWNVGMSVGYMGIYRKDYDYCVWPVRGGQ